VSLRFSVVAPVYNEGERIVGFLDQLLAALPPDCEVRVVYDQEEDTTAPHAQAYAERDSRVVPTLNTYGRGPANAIRYGIDHAGSEVVVVTMADGSDDPRQIPLLAGLVEGGSVIAAGSRYCRGGRQHGGPLVKGLMSRLAGLTLGVFGRVGTHDATSNFKAYSRPFIRDVGIESVHGFELALEMVAKARRLRLPVSEIGTEWRDRTGGQSNFKIVEWLPHYIRWYLFAYGPRLDLATMAERRKEDR
jgi:glycosyltransferase involved in cell wall biosynthesis